MIDLTTKPGVTDCFNDQRLPFSITADTNSLIDLYSVLARFLLLTEVLQFGANCT